MHLIPCVSVPVDKYFTRLSKCAIGPGPLRAQPPAELTGSVYVEAGQGGRFGNKSSHARRLHTGGDHPRTITQWVASNHEEVDR